MLSFLINRFIPNSENVYDTEVRKQYGVLGGILGIICNLFLFMTKLVAGMVINSIAVISDAFNNLSDLGTSLVTVIGARVGGKRADREHPYGHGRAEYISALVISFLIIFFGAELLKSSVSDIVHPETVSFNILSVIILIISVPIKLWMWYYNRVMGMKINSSILLAAATDSRNDVISTMVVIFSAIIASNVSFPIDGIAGVLISALIIKAGVGVAKDTIDRLMGTAPNEVLIESIEKLLVGEDMVLGMHDLMVHDYGPGRTIASVHAEVPDSLSLVEVHDIIDEIEHKIMEELGVDIVIHTDPVSDLRRK